MPEYIYIHIPFCRRKCLYCAFSSITNTALIPEYLKSLKSEIRTFYKGEKLKTLYFGGGTPSLLDAKQIDGILKCFDIQKDTEVTIEINPDSADKSFLKELRSIGINRLSVGVQSFDDSILQSIGRLHDSFKAAETLKTALDTGFSNISTDFIYGLPSQSLESFISDLNTAIELGVSHISLYGLKIEEGTPFSNNPPKNIADPDMQADMYTAAIDFLKAKGFLHYEISNFSIPGNESKHNLNYWNCGEYYGFGAAAHGYINGVRYENNRNIQKYISNPLKKTSTHTLSLNEKLEEAVFLGLRRGDGINFSDFEEKFGIDFKTKYSAQLDKYKDFFVFTPENCFFNTKGFLVSNIILSDFLE